MKTQLYQVLFLIFFMILSVSLQAQLNSKLSPSQLLFSDLSNPFAGTWITVNGLNIQNGFNSTSVSSSSVSAGTDLLQTSIGTRGLTVKNFAISPGSESNLDLKELKFITSGFGSIGLDEETWTLGITDVGQFDGSDPVQSAFFLNYNRIIDDVAIINPLLFINPDEANIGIGTFDQNFNAQLYVEESGQDQIAVSGNNNSVSDATKWGLYGVSQGTGTGVRYGVVGQAFNSSGAKYGVLGTASSDGGGYAVYASGDLAYTGTISDVSDRKLKKNIQDFTALESVLKLQPKTYEMRRDEFQRMNLATGRRYGFIAQDLQEIFPDLVREQIHSAPYQDGDSLSVEQIDYLGVEYIGMIPILTKAMQEQQEQIEAKDQRISTLERENRALQRQFAGLEDRLQQLETLLQQSSGQGNSSIISVSDARLEQNQPNPFGNSTAIPHLIPAAVRSAVLRITNVHGQVLKEIVIAGRGEGQTMLQTDQLSGGTYFYSLVLDGEVVDTKKMVSVR